MAISPILSNQLNDLKKRNTEHEKLYQDLVLHSGEMKPNAPKAKLLNYGPVSAPMAAAIDTYKDAQNFKTAVKTGKMSDNNLGRINDLGLKLGAILTAVFLGIHSKTKTEAAMRFIGGGAFLASMSLWPKIFINTPAKLIHNVKVDQKYINNQGDKKDFYLDNQFLPWDITGIKDEKEQRRRQKVALQNRTLWMATAGFATPLMTALISNAAENPVKNTIIKLETDRTRKVLGDKEIFERLFNEAGAKVKNAEELSNLIEEYSIQNPDKEFFFRVDKMFRVNDSTFKDPDAAKALSAYAPTNLQGALKKLWQQEAVYDITESTNLEELKEVLSNLQVKGAIKKASPFAKGDVAASVSSAISTEEVEEIIKSLGNKFNLNQLREAIENHPSIAKGTQNIEDVISLVRWDNKKYFEELTKYNAGTIAKLRARVEEYIKLCDPIVGDKLESQYTNTYFNTMKKFFSGGEKIAPISSLDKTAKKAAKEAAKEAKNKAQAAEQILKDSEKAALDSLDTLANGSKAEAQKVLEKYFQSILKEVGFNSAEYKEITRELSQLRVAPEIRETAQELADPERIAKAFDVKSNPILDEAIFSSGETSIAEVLRKFIHQKTTNIDAITSRPVICANFEARLKAGLIRVHGKDISQSPELLEAARKIVYAGNVSVKNNKAGLTNKNHFEMLCESIFNPEAFKDESETVQKHVQGLLSRIKDTSAFDSTEKYLENCDFTALVKKYATKVFNDKSWMKKFGTASAILAIGTLLIQPFFGNIKKEYPDEKGGAK